MQRSLALAIAFLALASLAAWAAWRLWPASNGDVPAVQPAPVAEIASPPAVRVALEGSSRATPAASHEAVPYEAPPRAARRPATIVVEGHVLDVPLDGVPAQGVGARGVEVRAAFGGRGPDYVETTSADDGSFRLELEEPGARPVTVLAWVVADATRRPTEHRAVLTWEQSDVTGVRLLLHVKGHLVGRTIEPDGTPIPGVVVELRTHDVVSDDEGRFLVEDFRGKRVRSARKPGYMLKDAGFPRSREGGGWEPIDVVLSPTATLAVRVEDAAGRPFPGARVRLAPSAAERFGSSGWAGGARSSEVEAEDGTAVWTRAWAKQKLRVAVQLGVGWTWSERAQGDLLLLETREEGAPIVLAPGEERSLRFVVPERRTLVGEVVDANGIPVPSADVTFSSLDPNGSSPEGIRTSTKANENGRFELELASSSALRRGRIFAYDRSLSEWGLGNSATELLDFDALPRGDLRVTLRLSPLLSIGGRVEGPEGQPVRGAVFARPTALTGIAGYENFLRRGIRKGTFLFDPLIPGTYDLHVRPKRPYRETWIRDVPAGTQDVVVRVERGPLAKVVLEARCALDLKDVTFVHGRWEPSSGLDAGVGELGLETVYDSPRGWPDAPSDLKSMFLTHRDERGSAMLVVSPAEDGTQTLALELAPGVYWFGARARAKGAGHCFPIGTGPVRVGGGEHFVRFELVRTAQLEGRVVGSGASPDLCVALAGPGGELLELDTLEDRPQPVLELASDGSFAWRAVPWGDWRLRVGTWAELVRGGFRYEQPLSTGPHEHAGLEIRLGS